MKNTKENTRIWLIISTVLVSLLLLFSLPFIIMSPMMFDAPESTGNPVLQVTFFSLFAFPIFGNIIHDTTMVFFP